MEPNCTKKCIYIKIISWLPTITVMLMISMFSSADGTISSEQSRFVTGLLVQGMDSLFDMGLDPGERAILIGEWIYYIRKMTHFCEYALLGLTLLWPLNIYSLTDCQTMGIAWIIGSLYAVSDELHQVFVAGRTPAVKDVLIDSSGIAFGILCGYTVYKIYYALKQYIGRHIKKA